MSSHALSWMLLQRRAPRAFFLARTTQRVKSGALARELTRAVAALGGLAAWAGVLALLAE